MSYYKVGAVYECTGTSSKYPYASHGALVEIIESPPETGLVKVLILSLPETHPRFDIYGIAVSRVACTYQYQFLINPQLAGLRLYTPNQGNLESSRTYSRGKLIKEGA